MDVSQDNEIMEGWLYLIRSNRIGLQYSRKRYFVLEDHVLKSFKAVPASKDEVLSFFLFLFIFPVLLMMDRVVLSVYTYLSVSLVWGFD